MMGVSENVFGKILINSWNLRATVGLKPGSPPRRARACQLILEKIILILLSWCSTLKPWSIDGMILWKLLNSEFKK